MAYGGQSGNEIITAGVFAIFSQVEQLKKQLNVRC